MRGAVEVRILQATTAVGWSGGTEQCLLLAKYMRDLGEDASILAMEGSELDRRASSLGIPVLYFPNRRKFSLKEARALARVLEAFDVVNTHISKAHWFVWSSLFFARRIPVLVYSRRVPYSISFLSLFTKYNFRTRGIIAVSPQIYEELSRKPFIGKRVRYIPSGVELGRFSPAIASDVRRELGIPDRAVVFANVGNFSSVKGQKLLLRAFKRLVDNLSGEFFLLLVGRDTDSKEALKLIDGLSLRGRVFPLGFKRDVPRILGCSDIFVFPSLNEGIAGSLLQAMAMEKVVVASYVGGIKSYLKHMENGIAIEPGSVDSLYRGMELALQNLSNERMKKEARRTAEEFDIKKVAQRTLEFYRELVYGKVSGI